MQEVTCINKDGKTGKIPAAFTNTLMYRGKIVYFCFFIFYNKDSTKSSFF